MGKDLDTLVKLYITTACASQILIECMDELQGTKLYKGKLKAAATQLDLQITKQILPSINEIFGIDYQASMDLMSALEVVIKKVATLKHNDIIDLSNLIDEQND